MIFQEGGGYGPTAPPPPHSGSAHDLKKNFFQFQHIQELVNVPGMSKINSKAIE